MSDLRLPMNELSFEQLVTLGRSVIPSAAPRWTDHNVHDPGIMLMELMAWIAEAQMYSVGRIRRDERFAYARLLDVHAQGPTPSHGLIWPFAGDERGAAAAPQWLEGTAIAANTRVTPDRPHAPVFFTTGALALTTARIVKVETIFADGARRDWTAANVRDGATFEPFGSASSQGDRLVLTFAVPDESEEDIAGPLSIGIEIINQSQSRASSDVASTPPRKHRLMVTLEETGTGASGPVSRPLRIVSDSTAGLLKSGVLLIDFGGAPPTSQTFAISIASASDGFVRAPRVQRIAPNVLPVVQRETIDDPNFGTLRAHEPNQTYRIERAGVMFPDPDGAVRVRVAENGVFRDWSETFGFEASGPGDRHFQIDYTSDPVTVTFGNGVNGFVPDRASAIAVRYSVCGGSRGNVPRNLHWMVAGVTGDFGVNSEPMTGGVDARGLRELQNIVQERARRSRPLVTSRDLEQAALAFRDLDVNRAVEMPPSAKRRTVRGTRTLVVLSGRDRQDPTAATAAAARPAESRELLDEVHSRLAPRLPVGQRLEVIGPRYVPIRVRATLLASAKADPERVRKEATRVLYERVKITAAGDGREWPFGRDVTLPSVKGWLRIVEGVERVEAAQLLAGDDENESVVVVRLGARDLPLLRNEPGDLEIKRPAIGRAR